MGLTYKQKFNKRYGFEKNEGHSLQEISKLTGIRKAILQKVYNRGVGAHSNNLSSVRLKTGEKDPKAPRSQKMTKQQWAYARVYSFVGQGKTTRTADKDLWEKRK